MNVWNNGLIGRKKGNTIEGMVERICVLKLSFLVKRGRLKGW
jgi:hypothetical protein